MRWKIEIPKKRIVSYDFKNHFDDIEMSGEKTSVIVKYGLDNNDNLKIYRRLIYPLFRIQPDTTTSSYQFDYDEPSINFKNEVFQKVEIDGILSIYTKTGDLEIVHRFYPSTTQAIVYERIEIKNKGIPYDVKFDEYKRIDTRLGCEGWIYSERIADAKPFTLNTNEECVITFSFSARFCNQRIKKEKSSYEKRINKVNELIKECDLTTGDDVIDTMFAFAKIRAGESIFNTRCGKIHSPGGVNYYAAIWSNDQCEYSTPWFAFTNDKNEKEAAFNAMDWFESYMNDIDEPLVSSIISEKTDYWNGAGDRGDSEMYLYGCSRLYLTRGELPDRRHYKMLKWAANYIENRIMDNGIVYSDTDELEGRISSGINLSTNSLAYGAFNMFSILLERMNKTKEAKKYHKLASGIRESIDEYFGGNISGYDTYHYHKGCDQIRAWLALPAYMGIKERARGSLDAIDKFLWRNSSVLSTEGEKTTWDRSAFYYIAALFRNDESNKAFDKLKELSETRLLKERVPYAIEAYPENNMRHLSGESALYCRTIVDGLLNISFNKDGFTVIPSLPDSMKTITMKHIYINGKYHDIIINDGKVIIK